MSRIFFLLYGSIAYLIFFATFMYLIGFTTNLWVPKAIDGVQAVPLSTALITNTILILIFGIQHSLMARRSFKKWWTKYIPEPIERSTYVLFSSLALILLFSKWEPMGGIIWSVSSPLLSGILLALSLLGFAIVLVSSFIINHFDLFGLRQVWLYFRKKAYTSLQFDTVYLYKYVRHPLYFGIVLAFWASPVMTVPHLIFAILLTIYVLVGIYLEEKDLIKDFGERYLSYKKRVPMLIPFFRKKNQTKVGPAIQKEKNILQI